MATQQEAHLHRQRQFRIALIVVFVVLMGGATFYHFVENLSWLDAFYFSTITLTTVGYGDISPHTDIGKLFTIFYVLTGVGILATFASLLVRNAVERRAMKRSDKS